MSPSSSPAIPSKITYLNPRCVAYQCQEPWKRSGAAPNCPEGFWEQGLGLQTSVLLIIEREMEEATHNAQDTVTPPTPELNKPVAEQQGDIRIFVEEQRLFLGGTRAVNLCARDP